MEINIMIRYELTEEEIETFLSADYGICSKTGNKTVGKYIVKTIDSFEIKEDRSCFYSQRVKNLTIKSLSRNKRFGHAIKMGIASNYVHQMIAYQIDLFLFYRNNQNLRRSIK
jgi:hypothetical protein